MLAGTEVQDLYLVRHGESVANSAGEFVGRRDVPLNETGRAQAGRAAEYLARVLVRPAMVVSSPLMRASETASRIAEALGTVLERDPMLTELDFGDLEGRKFVEFLADWPPPWVKDSATPCPGGESYDEVALRVTASLSRWAAAASGNACQSLVVVTHLGPIKTLVHRVLDGSAPILDKFHVGCGSTTHLRQHRGRLVVVSVNVLPEAGA